MLKFDTLKAILTCYNQFHKAKVQRALQKKGCRRNSNSYVGSTAVKPTFSNQNSLGNEQSSLHRAVTMSCPPIDESHDGLSCARPYEFISWKPAHKKSPIGFNHPTLLIKPIRCTGFHHLQPATQAWHVDDALCLKVANK
jgi:hypothetical protein